MEPIKAVDIKIFPYRRLKPATTERILNEIMKLEGILRVLLNGESLPQIVGYGPAKGTRVNHEDRKVIKLKDHDLELSVTVGDIIITVLHEKQEVFLKKLEDILGNNLSCNFEVSAGIFTKTNITVSDYLKIDRGIEQEIEPTYIGLVDPGSKSEDTVRLIGD